MIRRLPVVATMVVLIAVGIMIRLGFWQLERKGEKEAMLARFEAAQAMSSEVPWPRDAAGQAAALFRHSSLGCARILAHSPKAGRSDKGESGWVHVIRCALAGGGEADVSIGWSREPSTVRFEDGLVAVAFDPNVSPPQARLSEGGEFRGIIAPGGKNGARLVAAPPAIGLGGNALPDPRDIPNNHFAYAVQWFLFAGVALVIYALAVRKRLLGT